MTEESQHIYKACGKKSFFMLCGSGYANICESYIEMN